ncbi:MAG: TolC family protein [Candidatus Omnitrophica bacterium]|nr:TolC family protein [Candidatus Omnitrophota bacterium]MBI3083228.1 TolC family protein [Candidatus Omnitrophota bacterium]
MSDRKPGVGIALSVGLVALSSFLFPATSGGEETVLTSDTTPLSLEELLGEAKRRNPTLRAAQEQWRAARLRVPQASALPDPMVGYMVMGKMLETSLGPQKNIFEAEQMVPFPGKLWEKRQIAGAEAQASKAKLQMTERDVMLKVSETYYDLYATDAVLGAVEEIDEALKKFEGIAQARYAAQGGSQRDVAKAQAEVSDVLQRLLMLRQQRETVAAMLNALLDRDPHTPVGRAEQPELPMLSQTLEELLAMAEKKRPELGEASAMVKREKHANTLAKLEYLPDVSVGFQYNRIGAGTTTMANDGRDAWMVPLKINVPLWQNRLIPGVLEAKHNLRTSQAKLAQAENLTEYEVKDAYYRFTAAKQIVEVYQNALIPEAELAFQSDQAGYEAGRVDVLNLIDSERVYLNAQVAYYQALAEALKSFATLERSVGTELQAASSQQPAATSHEGS